MKNTDSSEVVPYGTTKQKKGVIESSDWFCEKKEDDILAIMKC